MCSRPRLIETFMRGQEAGTRFTGLLVRENLCRTEAKDLYPGFLLISQCFLEFLNQTIDMWKERAPNLAADRRYGEYYLTWQSVASATDRLRSAEILFLNAYPLDGYALLRDLEDRAVYLAAILKGHTTFTRLLGATSGEDGVTDDRSSLAKQFLARRKKEQRRILKQAKGPETGLERSVLADIEQRSSLFDYEVHFSILSLAIDHDFRVKVSKSPRAEPLRAVQADAHFMNRYLEISWCLLRTLPVLQPSPSAFGEDWASKWSLLNEQLGYCVREVSEGGKKAIGSFVTWVESQFGFSPSWCYPPEDDASGTTDTVHSSAAGS
jgi:hypothetical protein